jgi:aminoglycoside phosphotransferase (APT) family kinase protein
MSSGRMHAEERDVDRGLVGRLLATQYPAWADLPIAPVRSAGTDNALFRLGEGMVVRLPRIARATGQVATEQRWLSALAPQLPLAIPEPLALGRPGEGYPWPWSVYR